MRGLSSFVSCAIALMAPVVLATAGPSDAFVIAVVRDDGVIVPAAAHDRGRWRMPWPGPVKEAVVPVTIDDCPLAWWGLAAAPREWTLYAPDASPTAIAPEKMTWVPSYCKQQVALHSRAATRPLLRPAEGGRAPKYGVAAAGPARVELPRRIDPDSAEARALLDAVHAPFNRHERLMLARDYFAVYTPTVDAATRDRMPVEALAIHQGPGRDGTVYFVELARRYARRTPEDLRWCDEVSYMAGWVRRGSDRTLDLTPVVRAVTSCLLDTTQRASPLAVVHTDRGPVWFLELYRPDSEVLGVFRAPEGDEPEPLLIREIGRCEDRGPRRAPMPLPDVSVP
jgi:hypothetical protein